MRVTSKEKTFKGGEIDGEAYYVHLPSFKHRYVYKVMSGSDPVRKIFHKRKQIFPSNEDRIATMTVDTSSIDGTKEEAFFLHAIASSLEGANAEKWMRLYMGDVDQRIFMINSTYGSRSMAKFSNGTFTFEKDAPLFSSVKIGDVIALQACVPQRYLGATAWYGNDYSGLAKTYDLPWLPGMKWKRQLTKGWKKGCAGFRGRFIGLPSNTVHVQYNGQKNGHCRGTYTYLHENKIQRLWDQGEQSVSVDKAIVGDKRIAAWIDLVYNGGGAVVDLLAPAFWREWKLPIISITMQS